MDAAFARANGKLERIGFEEGEAILDHVLLPEGLDWEVRRAAWTLRPADVGRLTGEPYALSDHPGIVVDLERTGARGVAALPDVR